MKEKYLYDKIMFELNAGGYCGLYMPNHVMKKIIKLQANYENKIKQILNEYKDELYPADWTMETEREKTGNLGKSVYLKYAIGKENKTWDNVESCIKLFKPNQPEKIDLYIVPNRETATAIAKELLAEKLKKKEGSK